MERFSTLTAIAAPFAEPSIDTDVIFPARFLLLPDKTGLGQHLFHERRYAGGAGAEPFVLDRPPYDAARILVTGPNFGTGSSREQAVWALADFGIRCVIGPSFGEIFFSNCFKNGVLPIIVSDADQARVLAQAEAGRAVTIDLPAKTITLSDGPAIPFDVESYRKRALIEGLDEIGMVLTDDLADIAAFEATHRARRPWLFLTPAQLAHFDDITEPLANE